MNKGQKIGFVGALAFGGLFLASTSKEGWKSIGGAAKKYWPKISKVGDILLGDNGSRNQ